MASPVVNVIIPSIFKLPNVQKLKDQCYEIRQFQRSALQYLTGSHMYFIVVYLHYILTQHAQGTKMVSILDFLALCLFAGCWLCFHFGDCFCSLVLQSVILLHFISYYMISFIRSLWCQCFDETLYQLC